uniref:Uncharacterized protein n=2 Tax=Trichogramma kaykai TaxID=54128 RepID=A0ABD2WJZ7_9HYME
MRNYSNLLFFIALSTLDKKILMEHLDEFPSSEQNINSNYSKSKSDLGKTFNGDGQTSIKLLILKKCNYLLISEPFQEDIHNNQLYNLNEFSINKLSSESHKIATNINKRYAYPK